MTIWVYANGWPVPPTVLLGCVVAEILYIRGWMSLVKEDVTKKAARAALLMPVRYRGIAGSGGASTSSSRFSWHLSAILLPSTFSLVSYSGYT